VQRVDLRSRGQDGPVLLLGELLGGAPTDHAPPRGLGGGEALAELETESRVEGGEPPPPRPAPAARSETPRSEAVRSEAPRRIIAPEPAAGDDGGDDILIVVSKLKKYIRTRSGMNTSDNVMAVLSDHLRRVCELAIRHAAEEGRKTVLDRDFKAIL
jgi:hypothetical protein